ncbi:MAG: hypothetical protein ABIH00_07325 [Armatimonadota bacterium]
MAKYNKKIKLEGGKEIILRQADVGDMDEIKHLYYTVYGGKYTLPEINDSDKMKWIINDSNYFWLVGEDNGEIVSSVIAVVEPDHRIGKVFAGVVHPDFRGHKLLKTKIKIVNDVLLDEQDKCDLVYAVVRTFAPLSLHEDLHSLGYVDLGIFPNVRKVQSYETHGLKAYYKKGTLAMRKAPPCLIPSANNIYEITREKLSIDPAQIDETKPDMPERSNLEADRLYIEKSPEVEWEYYEKRKKGKLSCDFFPLHYPQIKLYTKDKKSHVYIHFLAIDGHASIMGFRTDQDPVLFLNFVCEYLESMGVKYLEIVAPAYDSVMQNRLYLANFLPCAYFPAFSFGMDGKRYDHIVFCRNFVPLNFQGMHFFSEAKAYAKAFYKNYSDKLWGDLEGA